MRTLCGPCTPSSPPTPTSMWGEILASSGCVAWLWPHSGPAQLEGVGWLPGSGLDSRQPQQGLGDAQEVDHLSNAEQRGDDQGAAVSTLQEGCGALVPQDLPVGGGESELQGWGRPTPAPHPPGAHQPGAVQEPRVGVLVDAALERLEPGLHHCRGRAGQCGPLTADPTPQPRPQPGPRPGH